MKNILPIFCLIIFIFIACNKDNGTNNPIENHGKIYVYYYGIEYNSLTDKWDLSTKSLRDVYIYDGKNEIKPGIRYFNYCFGKNNNAIGFYGLYGYYAHYNNIGCLLEYRKYRDDYLTCLYDESNYIKEIYWHDSINDSKRGEDVKIVHENGKLLYTYRVDTQDTIKFEYGMNGYIIKSYSFINSYPRSDTDEYFQNENGLLYKIITHSSDYHNNDTSNFIYDLYGNLIEQEYAGYLINYFYNSENLIIKETWKNISYPDYDFTYNYKYNNNNYLIEIIIEPKNGKKSKLIVEYEFNR